MIRGELKLPDGAILKIPEIVDVVSEDDDFVALYSFGSLASGNLKPLSDLDFAVLLTRHLTRKQRFDKQLGLIGIFNRIFKTDEIDLILLNDAPARFAFQILKTGKLLACKNQSDLIDFNEYVIKTYLDFNYFRKNFDSAFLKGIGYYG